LPVITTAQANKTGADQIEGCWRHNGEITIACSVVEKVSRNNHCISALFVTPSCAALASLMLWLFLNDGLDLLGKS
jgi:hypothetical protein